MGGGSAIPDVGTSRDELQIIFDTGTYQARPQTYDRAPEASANETRRLLVYVEVGVGP